MLSVAVAVTGPLSSHSSTPARDINCLPRDKFALHLAQQPAAPCRQEPVCGCRLCKLLVVADAIPATAQCAGLAWLDRWQIHVILLTILTLGAGGRFDSHFWTQSGALSPYLAFRASPAFKLYMVLKAFPALKPYLAFRAPPSRF